MVAAYLHLTTITTSIIAIALQCSVWPVGSLLFGKEGRSIKTQCMCNCGYISISGSLPP